ncbi:MAG: ADP-ribosylglycohydrolase family protein [Promethearchaeia archaeon]
MYNLREKFIGTILGVAIGDTLGHPFEGILREEILAKFENFEDYIKKHRSLFKTYTDDTQLTLHTAQALIDGYGLKLETLIREYIRWLDDPPIGAGYGCISSIRKLRYGIPWEEAASNSGGNGTAMRVSPIGLFYRKDPDTLKSAAEISSRITHSHPAASAAAIVIARAVSYLVEKSPSKNFSVDEFFYTIIEPIRNSNNKIWEEFIEILEKVRKNLHISIEAGLIKFSQAGVKSPYFIQEYLGKAFVHPYALSTVACAIFIFLKNLHSFRDCIYTLSTAGGDSDTVGAIGGSLAGAFFGLSNIPNDLIKLVKDSKKIIKIAELLYERHKDQY